MRCDIVSRPSPYFISHPALRNAVFFFSLVCEPALNQFATWSRRGSLYFPFIPTFSPKTGKKKIIKEKNFPLVFLAAPYQVVCLDLFEGGAQSTLTWRRLWCKGAARTFVTIEGGLVEIKIKKKILILKLQKCFAILHYVTKVGCLYIYIYI